ncbi:conserved hypothetical protein [Ricinus communis]|uniref:Uncharacterized protein n=1 Tax=Ricinus communis TaxID=3988 RepID=B9TJK2_RICCO|nr:conserved hypothetical protein [Ricinus communis]
MDRGRGHALFLRRRHVRKRRRAHGSATAIVAARARFRSRHAAGVGAEGPGRHARDVRKPRARSGAGLCQWPSCGRRVASAVCGRRHGLPAAGPQPHRGARRQSRAECAGGPCAAGLPAAVRPLRPAFRPAGHGPDRAAAGGPAGSRQAAGHGPIIIDRRTTT